MLTVWRRPPIDVPLCLTCALACLPLFALAADDHAATPYRPTISNPAELSLLRHLEVELGAIYAQTNSMENTGNLPFLLKFPFHSHWGLLLGGTVWGWQHGEQQNADGFGDITVAVKHYHPLFDDLALGFEAGATLPTAPSALSIGRTDYFGNFIASQDIGDLRIDANIGLTRQGQLEANGERLVYNWALAGSYPLSAQWGFACEFSGAWGALPEPTGQFLTAFNYAIMPKWVVDFGAAAGLTQASDRFNVFAGFVYLLE